MVSCVNVHICCSLSLWYLSGQLVSSFLYTKRSNTGLIVGNVEAESPLKMGQTLYFLFGLYRCTKQSGTVQRKGKASSLLKEAIEQRAGRTLLTHFLLFTRWTNHLVDFHCTYLEWRWQWTLKDFWKHQPRPIKIKRGGINDTNRMFSTTFGADAGVDLVVTSRRHMHTSVVSLMSSISCKNAQETLRGGHRLVRSYVHAVRWPFYECTNV